MDIKAYIESGVIESYVLGMADAQETAELEQLSRQYPEIRKAIDDFELNLEMQSLATAVMPSPEVKKQLLNKLDFAKEEKARVVGFQWTRYVAAASVILLVASAALNIYFYNQFRSTSNAYQALLIEKTSLIADSRNMQTKALELYNNMQMMSDPSFMKVSMSGDQIPGKAGNLATVFWNSKSKDVYLLPNKLAAAPPGMQYQLWAIVDGKPVDAGMIGACAGLCKMKNIPTASMFAVTLEKEGGVPSPTMSQMYVAGKVG
ncbi:MAG: anti-sigma factor [Bacteroidota bacterium]